MNVIVVGLGSMGKRRIRILKKLYINIQIYGVDLIQERREFCRSEYKIFTYKNIEDVLALVKFKAAFICTSPLSHDLIIEKCLKKKMHVFSEINLVSDGYEKNMALAQKYNLILFLSSTPLYRKEIGYFIDKIHNCNSVVNYTYHVGQYLLDWHPWEKIDDFFVKDKKSNGCRELFAIELPWLIKAFGNIKSMQIISGKDTSLPINYEDNYMLMLVHEGGNKGILVIDLICREAVRSLDVFSENLYIEWRGTEDSLKFKNIEKNRLEKIVLYENVDKNSAYSKNIIENAYSDEVKNFFEAIDGKCKMKYSFKEDQKVLKIIDEIEKHKI